MYLGVMYNFGIGTERNLYRAKRYYEHAIKGGIESSSVANKDDDIEPQLKYLLRALIWLIDATINPGVLGGWLSPILEYLVVPIIEYFVKYYLLPVNAIKIVHK